MLAIDTNVVIRFLVLDDVDQSSRAHDMVRSNSIFIPTTVILEAEWVLRSAFSFEKLKVVAALKAFTALPQVTVQDGDRVARALDWAERGLDLADALHLAACGGCDAFMTFDKRFERHAKGLGPIVRSP